MQRPWTSENQRLCRAGHKNVYLQREGLQAITFPALLLWGNEMSKLEIWKDRPGKWRWTLKADNGRIIGASSQGYRRWSDCANNIRQVAKGLGSE